MKIFALMLLITFSFAGVSRAEIISQSGDGVYSSSTLINLDKARADHADMKEKVHQEEEKQGSEADAAKE